MHYVPYHDCRVHAHSFGWSWRYLPLHGKSITPAHCWALSGFPIILAFFLAGSVSTRASARRQTPMASSSPLHVPLRILAYAGFALSCVLSLCFLGKERRLRHAHQVGDCCFAAPAFAGKLLERMSTTRVLVDLSPCVVQSSPDISRWNRPRAGQHWYFDPQIFVTWWCRFCT